MRAIDPELQARLDGGATTLCRCWRIRRADGVALGFTDHDEDVTFGGLVCRAGTGMDATALQIGTGLSVDNAQAAGALADAAIVEDDIRAGLYDRAEIDHWLVDWERPDLRVHLFRGRLGEIRRNDAGFEAELRGLAEELNAPVGRSLLRTCDRVLGDAKCGFALDAPGFSAEGVALDGSSGSRLVAVGLEAFDADWFTGGALRWVAGGNVGRMSVVKMDRLRDGIRVLDLWSAPGRALAAGDGFKVFAGCDKSAATCRRKFDNFLNFRGFPHMPGEDWVTAYPKDGEVHDGSSHHGG
jgi:uncharacterized phage protein (TIGR02218 family)